MKDWLTPKELAALAGFSDSFIYEEIRAGAVTAQLVRSTRRVRGRWRIARADAATYLQRLGVSVRTEPTKPT